MTGYIWNTRNPIPIKTVGNRNLFSRPATVPEKAHPLVKELFKAMVRQGDSYIDIARRSGVSPRTIRDWRGGRVPDLINIEACLNVYDRRLCVGRVPDRIR